MCTPSGALPGGGKRLPVLAPPMPRGRPPRNKLGGKWKKGKAADQEAKKPHQKQTGGEAANLDGPKSSHPLMAGESGRPMANPPLQTQTVEGPENRRNTSKDVSNQTNNKISSKSDCRPASPCANDTSGIRPRSVVAVHGSTAFSSIVRKQVRENKFQTTNSRKQVSNNKL